MALSRTKYLLLQVEEIDRSPPNLVKLIQAQVFEIPSLSLVRHLGCSLHLQTTGAFSEHQRPHLSHEQLSDCTEAPTALLIPWAMFFAGSSQHMGCEAANDRHLLLGRHGRSACSAWQVITQTRENA